MSIYKLSKHSDLHSAYMTFIALYSFVLDSGYDPHAGLNWSSLNWSAQVQSTSPDCCRSTNWGQWLIIIMFPAQQVAGQPERSSCSRYELGLVQNLSAFGTRPSLELVHNLSALEGCKDGWTYSTEYYQSTVVSEVRYSLLWNLLLQVLWQLFIYFNLFPLMFYYLDSKMLNKDAD